MQHTVGRRRGRRRISVAVLTTAMTLAAVVAVSAPASSAGRAASRARADEPRTRELRRPRPRRRRGSPSARTARARVDLARRLGTQGVIESDPVTGTLRMVGRLDGYLTGRSARPAQDRRHRVRPIEPRGLRIDQGRPQDVPPAAGLRGHRGRAPHLVDAGEARRAGVPQRPPRERDGRRTPAQHHRLAGARDPRRRRPSRASASDAAIGAARVDGGAHGRRRAELRLGVARAVPDGTRRPARMEDVHLAEHAAAHHVGGRRPERVRPVPAEPHRATTTGTATAWEFYPSDLVPAGANVANPVTFPVVDGTSLNGDNAHVWADVKDNNKPDPGEEIPAVSGTDWSMPAVLDTTNAAQNCTTSRPCTWDKNVPVQLAGEHGAERRPGHVLPEQVPRPPGRSALRLHGGGGQLRERRAATRSWARRWTGRTRATASRTRTTSTTPTWARRPTGSPRRCRCTCSARAPGLPLPERERRRRRRGRVPRVHARPVRAGWSCTRTARRVCTTQQASSMGEGWSDWYAEDFLNNQGFKPDTAAIGDVVDGRLSRSPACCGPSRSTARSARRLPCGGSQRRGPRRLHVRGLRQGRSASPRCTPTARSGWRPSGRSVRRSARPIAETLVTRGDGAVAAGARRTWTCGTRSSRPTW